MIEAQVLGPVQVAVGGGWRDLPPGRARALFARLLLTEGRPVAVEQLVDDLEGLVVVELDEAVAEGAPWPELGIQLVVTVTLQDPDPDGQPYGLLFGMHRRGGPDPSGGQQAPPRTPRSP